MPYTNASAILPDDVQDSEELDGLFSGWDPATGSTSRPWLFQRARPDAADAGHADDGHRRTAAQPPPTAGYDRDPTLEHPRCVFQVLKRHFARYTPEMVERSCGVPRGAVPRDRRGLLLRVGAGEDRRDLLRGRMDAALDRRADHPRRRRSCSCCSATSGGRAAASWRSAATPPSRARPTSRRSSTSCPAISRCRGSGRIRPRWPPTSTSTATATGWWSNFDKYIVSLLKAYYGDAATQRERLRDSAGCRASTGDHSHQGYWLDMMDGKVEGLFVMGQNPAVAAPNARLERQGAGASSSGWSCATWSKWRRRPSGTTRPRSSAASCGPGRSAPRSSCFPAAGHAEKEGCFTNTQRLLQWHEKAVDPPGDARSETWFIYHLGTRLKEKAERDPRPRNAGLNALTWDYSVTGAAARAARRRDPAGDQRLHRSRSHAGRRLRRSEGGRLHRVRLLDLFGCVPARRCGTAPTSGSRATPTATAGALRGRRTGASSTTARRRGPTGVRGASGSGWSGGTRGTREWTGLDTPDFTKTKPPDYQPPAGAEGDAALAGDKPFIMHADGLGWIWVPTGLADGPLPAHYEPLESPVVEPAVPGTADQPRRAEAGAAGQPVRALARSAVSLRHDDLPADRAPHGRRHVAHASPPRGAAAGVLLRDLAGAGGRARHRARRLAHDPDRCAASSRRARW